jgi:hypothetical protein
MRTGLALSIAGHVGLIAAGFVAFPEARPFVVPPVEALPVELVPVAELRDVVAGDRRAEIKPEEAPQPKPRTQAEVAAPKAADTPSRQVVEGAREPAERPIRDVTQQPKPEPAREEAVAALPREAEPAPPPPPEPVAAPPKPAEPVVRPEPQPETAREEIAPAPMPPKARPQPPRQVAAVQPSRSELQQPSPPRNVQQPPAPQPDFNPDDIAALLNKQASRGGGDPSPSPEPRTFGTSDGRLEAAMTQSEVDALKARLYSCWNPPRGVREAGRLTVKVAINLQPDGSLANPPRVLDGGFDQLSQIAAESAVRAVQICAPYDILPPEKYSLWQEIEFIFDPSEMLGG